MGLYRFSKPVRILGIESSCDETAAAVVEDGVTVRTTFDVKPGTYLIRLVVRDREERKLSATNGAVQIQ